MRVTNEVILKGVTRLGVNLGEQNFYDSGQMLRNLLGRNPEFAPMRYRTIFHCQRGGQGRCVDARTGIQFAPDFWRGASYEVLEGAAAGERGTVKASAAEAGGYVLSLEAAVGSGAEPIGDGDWLAVEKTVSDDAAAGWWPVVRGGARIEREATDLPPGSYRYHPLI